MELGVAKMMISQHYENRRKAEIERDDMYQELVSLTNKIKDLEDEREQAVCEKEKALQEKKEAQADKSNAQNKIRQFKEATNTKIKKAEEVSNTVLKRLSDRLQEIEAKKKQLASSL